MHPSRRLRRHPLNSLTSHSRSGKLLALFAVLLPTLIAFSGLILDGGLLTLAAREAQHVSDSAAMAAAGELAWGDRSAADVATEYAHVHNQLPASATTVHSPPLSGEFAGRSGFVEVTLQRQVQTHLMGAAGPSTVRTRSVAGLQPSTAPAAVVLLDPAPPTINVPVLGLGLPSIMPLLGGLEVVGLGVLRVNGAIHVNTTWGGVDEDWQLVGRTYGPPWGCSCTPLLPLTRVRATDVRVVGGVDNPNCYRGLNQNDPSPLQANRRPVRDPYRNLPAPTTASDPTNVSAVVRGGHLTIIGIPLIGPPTVLQPGIYDSIQVVSGRVIFQPGVYIIRGANPLTQISLNFLAGEIQAEGVMFYITGGGYSATTGLPDALDGEAAPPGPGILTLVPSVLIDAALPTNRFSPLNSPGSPFHGLLLHQRRQDRRPILIIKQNLLGNPLFSGNVYAKWAPVIITGKGLFQSAFVCGSLRVLDVLDCRIEPLSHLPAATDVYLVE
ncbi:MAG: hypothetical protein KF774_21145 [Planctomyces sp.]|nr:hypothetical protein [Planctomyces sp.]